MNRYKVINYNTENKNQLPKFLRFLKDNDAYELYMISINQKFKNRICNGDVSATSFLSAAFPWDIVEKELGLEDFFWGNLNDEWYSEIMYEK